MINWSIQISQYISLKRKPFDRNVFIFHIESMGMCTRDGA